MRRGLAIVREYGGAWFLTSFEAALAEAEASAGETDAGLRRLDDALAELERTEQRWYEAEMHRIRAEILLKRDPADTAAAEQSLQAAIAIAQSQKARSFELRAALSLAKLYRAANRDADAHAVLAPAVEGFPPTQHFPELTEAQALLAALAQSDEVRNAAAVHQRRLRLQTSYGQCADLGQGTSRAGNERGLCARPRIGKPGGRPVRTVLRLLRSLGGTFNPLRTRTDARNGRAFLARSRGPAELPRGLGRDTAFPAPPAFISAILPAPMTIFRRPSSSTTRRAMAISPTGLAQDPRAAAEIGDALTLWVLGRIDEALPLANRALADAESTAHAPTIGYALAFAALLGLFRHSCEAVATYSQALADIVSRYDLRAFFAGLAVFFQGWAKWSDGAEESRLAEMRRGLAIHREQGRVRRFLPRFEAALAEAEASAGETDAGLRRLDDALAELERTEERWYEAEMHRIRAEILLKRDPANTAAAEQSLQAAIAIAQSQKARSFELRAALSLAKLYRAANRDADAHAVLAPAVEGFPPTQQFPELAEAQALLAALSP